MTGRRPTLLIYYRTYTPHAFLGFLFGIDQSAVGRNVDPFRVRIAAVSRAFAGKRIDDATGAAPPASSRES